VPADDPRVWAAAEAGRVAALVWDWRQPEQAVSDRPFYTRIQPTADAAPARLAFQGLAPGAWRLEVRRTGFRRNDAYTRYLEMGSPKTLSAAQVAELNALTVDRPETARTVRVGRDGAFAFDLPMRVNDIVLATLTRA
jgi:xylan 1,4-beta-xylosidase